MPALRFSLQALGAFAAQKEARLERLQHIVDPDVIAAKLIASGRQRGSGAGTLDLTPVRIYLIFLASEPAGTPPREPFGPCISQLVIRNTFKR